MWSLICLILSAAIIVVACIFDLPYGETGQWVAYSLAIIVGFTSAALRQRDVRIKEAANPTPKTLFPDQ